MPANLISYEVLHVETNEDCLKTPNWLHASQKEYFQRRHYQKQEKRTISKPKFRSIVGKEYKILMAELRRWHRDRSSMVQDRKPNAAENRGPVKRPCTKACMKRKEGSGQPPMRNCSAIRSPVNRLVWLNWLCT